MFKNELCCKKRNKSRWFLDEKKKRHAEGVRLREQVKKKKEKRGEGKETPKKATKIFYMRATFCF
jgi:hypothetical protein